MAITPADIKLRFPEFDSVIDGRIQLFIDDATATVNPNCSNADLMIAYLTAHLLFISDKTDSGSGGNISPVISESVGDVSRSFGVSANNSNSDAYYNSTSYGQRYLDLRSNCIGRPIIG